LRVAAIQSSFIPWRGYFDFILGADIFVFYDDVQFSKNTWRNRNRIKTPQGSRWITVPVRHRSLSQLICETEIDEKYNWRADHLRLWRENYAEAQFFPDVLNLLGDLGLGTTKTISDLNIELTKKICEYLNISTPIMLSSELALEGTKTKRLIDLLKKLNASTYLSGPSADAYLDKEALQENGIQLEYKSYDYSPYPQLWGEFNGEVTILDLIANCGPQASQLICSNSPNTIIAPAPTSE
jgi:hypothetical protein